MGGKIVKLDWMIKSRTTIEEADKIVFKYTYIPMRAELQRNVKLIVKCKDPYLELNALGLSDDLRDIIESDFKVKQKQEKLVGV